MPYILRDANHREYPISARIQIGRDPANAVVVTDPLVSRIHATVWEEQGTLFLRDENSNNGTFVNGVRVRETILRPGDQIGIGNTLLVAAFASAVPQAASAPAAQPVAAFAPAAGPVATQPQPTPEKRKGGCAGRLFGGCLILIVLLAIAGVGGYAAYRAGLITPQTVLRIIGQGPGDLEFDNFRDDGMQVSILQLDVTGDSSPAEAQLELNPFDIRSYRAPKPGRYQIDFSTTTDGADLGTCTLSVKSGGQYQFVALPDMVVVNDVKRPPASGADLVVDSSALCR